MLNLNSVYIVSFLLYLSSPPLSEAKPFDHWYGSNSYKLLHVAGASCYPNYTAGNFSEYAKYRGQCKDESVCLCNDMATCLLQNLSDFVKSDMQSATTILSYIGPTIGEMALLSSRRPVLTVLLVLGTPAVFATRSFNLNNPAESLKRDAGTVVIGRQTRVMTVIISTTKYLIVALTAANCITNSVMLGASTILSWKCRGSYIELIWNFMALAPHLCAAISMRYSKVSHYPSFLLVLPPIHPRFTFYDISSISLQSHSEYHNQD